MSFLDKNGLQVLTTKLVQGDAIKVASHRGHTVKNVIDNITRECENVATPNTMTLENRVNEFKVGKGRDVDVSGDIEEGKIEVELQGKTWQNVVHGKKSVQSNIFTIEDGKYVFNNNATSSGGIVFSLICKPNTTYTLIINFLECALGDNTIYIDGHPVYLATTNKNLPKTKGTHAISFVTKDDVTDKKMKLAILSSSTSKLVIDENIIVLEGDHTQTPVEELPKYFDGIKSSFEDGVVDVEVQGKNLLNIKHKTLEAQGLIIEANEEKQQFIVNGSATGDVYVYFCGETWKSELNDSITNTNYSLTILTDGDVDVKSDRKDLLHVQMGYKDENNVSKSYFDRRVTQLGEVKCGLFRTGDYRITSPWFRLDKGNVYKNFVIKLQIQHQANTSYEPYYKKKISFNIGEPLRSLPNGVCDEIRINNGQWELVRRTAKVIFDGSEIWSKDTHNTGCVNTSRFFSIIRGSKVLLNPISNYPVLNMTTYSVDKENIQIASDGNIYIRILNYKLPTLDVEGFKKWLQANPTTVVYELATPTITPIEPISFDIKPLATITINSEIAPTSIHTVELNRASQIERGIVEIAELKKRVDNLELAYDSHLIETQHKLSLLGFEYELESEEI